MRNAIHGRGGGLDGFARGHQDAPSRKRETGSLLFSNPAAWRRERMEFVRMETALVSQPITRFIGTVLFGVSCATGIIGTTGNKPAIIPKGPVRSRLVVGMRTFTIAFTVTRQRRQEWSCREPATADSMPSVRSSRPTSPTAARGGVQLRIVDGRVVADLGRNGANRAGTPWTRHTIRPGSVGYQRGRLALCRCARGAWTS